MLYLFEDCELDLARVVLRRHGTETRIEPQVFDLLCFLIELRGQFVRKEELLDSVRRNCSTRCGATVSSAGQR